MAPNPIFVKLKVSDAGGKNYYFLGRPNGGNVTLSSKTKVALAPAEELFYPNALVAELIDKDILTRLFVSYTDANGYLKVASMLVAKTTTDTVAGLRSYENQTYKTA